MRKKELNKSVPIRWLEYSPIVYQDFMDIVSISRYKPKIVIIPINLQSFSEEWFSKPSNQFYVERLRARLRYVRFSWNDFMKYLQYKFTDKLEKEEKLWRNSEVIYGDSSLGIRAKIEHESEITSHYNEFDNLQNSIKLMRQFEYRYMNLIDRRGSCKMFVIPELFYRGYGFLNQITPDSRLNHAGMTIFLYFCKRLRRQ